MSLVGTFLGGLWDECEFEVHTNYLHDPGGCFPYCEHSDDGMIPYVAIMRNQGGNDSTGICMECMENALRKVRGH